MAVARLVCGDCGAALADQDRHCPQCGAPLDRRDSDRPNTHPRFSAPVRCEVCGNESTHGGHYCDSCGARLPGGQPEVTSESPRIKDKKKPPPIPKSKRKVTRKYETWQVVAGIVIIGVIAFFVYTEVIVYTEMNRDIPKAQSGPAGNPPPAVSMQDVDRMQSAVDANPNDAPSVLRLANALHDNALHDSRLLPRAIETYKKYLVLNPRNPDARVDLGICYFELGRVDTKESRSLFGQAIKEMETAFRTAPTHQPAAYNIGIVNLNAGNLDESARWLKKAMDLNPNSDLGQRAKNLLEQHSFQQEALN